MLAARWLMQTSTDGQPVTAVDPMDNPILQLTIIALCLAVVVISRRLK